MADSQALHIGKERSRTKHSAFTAQKSSDSTLPLP